MLIQLQKKLKYIYGPVYSWRLGVSLGIDPVTAKSKICNMDCVYCQLGRTRRFYTQRKIFVPTQEILKEIDALPPMAIDYYTFSGRGEPTLAQNLGEMIRALRERGKGKIAVITNAALIGRADVQKDLSYADCVLAKLDACDEASLQEVDIPARGIRFSHIVDGLKSFRRAFKGKLALQVMFMAQNQCYAPQIAQIARQIHPDEIEINTPLRPSAVKPLTKEELDQIKKHFRGLPAVSVYEAKKKAVEPLDEKRTILRHGNFRKAAAAV